MAELEICIDTIESAINAIEGGAHRLEICCALSEGGLTPSIGLVREIKSYIDKNGVPVKTYAMLRCKRGSDFVYSSYDMNVMLHDLESLKSESVDGFVYGALIPDRQIDMKNCTKIINAASPLPVTFHRAFDVTEKSDMRENLLKITNLGFKSLLTSGYESTAVSGIQNIIDMKTITHDLKLDIEIMPGSGVNPSNANIILEKTSCKFIHASARRAKSIKSDRIAMGGAADSEPEMICDKSIVAKIIESLHNIK